jgi:hypothetical protein
VQKYSEEIHSAREFFLEVKKEVGIGVDRDIAFQDGYAVHRGLALSLGGR